MTVCIILQGLDMQKKYSYNNYLFVYSFIYLFIDTIHVNEIKLYLPTVLLSSICGVGSSVGFSVWSNVSSEIKVTQRGH